MILSNLEALQSALRTIPKNAPEYPAAWRSLSDAPETLYALGNLSLLQTHKLAIVGSRRTPANVVKIGEELAKQLSQSYTLVTGTADGGDTVAIRGALSGSGKLICLLAGGFAYLPQGNLDLFERVAKTGLLLSLHPFETEIRAFSYEYRNKLLSALCDGALILSAGEKSGALITAKYAKEFGKKLFALPYPPNAAAGVGCNGLIKQGAKLTETAADVLEEFGVQIQEQKPQLLLSEDEQKLYEALQSLGESHVSVLSQSSGVPIFKARAVLSALEVKGRAVSLGGNVYTLV